MWNRLIVKIVTWALRNSRLSGENKIKITNVLLDNIQAVPFKNIISFSREGTILIRGKEMEPDQAIAFRGAAIALQDNIARKIIHDQVMFEAVKMGIHQGLNQDMIMFSKAAMWYGEEENRLLSSIVAEYN